MKLEWGPWIEHDGNGRPGWLREGMELEVELGDPDERMDIVGRVIIIWDRTVGIVEGVGCAVVLSQDPRGKSWTHPVPSGYFAVLRYRVRNPPGLQMLKDRMAKLPDAVAKTPSVRLLPG